MYDKVLHSVRERVAVHFSKMRVLRDLLHSRSHYYGNVHLSDTSKYC